MTLQQLRYIIEIEKTGSITKSAANMFMSQPNLSSALKELEAEIGIAIFNRTAKGVEVTDDGQELISYAKSILSQMDQLEFIFKDQKRKTVTLNVASTRSSYVVKVLTDFYNHLPDNLAIKLQLMETTTTKALEAVAEGRADIGRISYHESSYKTHEHYARKNRLIMELLWKVHGYILMSAEHPLAQKEVLTKKMLQDYTRVIYSDLETDLISLDDVKRRIYVNERGTMMDILAGCKDSYLWTISTHPSILKAHNLVAIPCEGAPSIVEAVVYSKNRAITKEMHWMLEHLRSTQYDEGFHIQEEFQPDTIL